MYVYIYIYKMYIVRVVETLPGFAFFADVFCLIFPTGKSTGNGESLSTCSNGCAFSRGP